MIKVWRVIVTHDLSVVKWIAQIFRLKDGTGDLESIREYKKMNMDDSVKKVTLITVAMTHFLIPFTSTSTNLAIPSLGEEFNCGALLLSWIVSSYILASVAFLLPFGRLADILGRKKIYILGSFIFSVFSFLCGAAWSIHSLILFRIVQGIGASMIFGTAMAILVSVFPPRERGKVLGITVATVYIGQLMGPALGGAVIHWLGWEYNFYLSALLGAVSLALVVFKLNGEWAEAKGQKFDLTGALLCMYGLIAFLYGVSSLVTFAEAKYILASGILGIILFVRHEIKAGEPILNMRLFSKNIVFAFSNLAALINFSATFASSFLLSLQLQVVMGFDPQKAGLILLSQPVVMAVLSPFAGKLSDRVEPRVVASWGMSLTALGLFIFGFTGKNTPVYLIMANLALLGIGLALFSSPNSNAILGSVDKSDYGVASSTMGTMRLVGQAVSIAVATLIIDFHLGSAQLGPAVASLILKSVNIAFIVFAFTCLGGVFASLAGGNLNTRKGLPS